MPETHRHEYKLQLTDDLEKEVIAFLNSHEGGKIYIEISDNEKVIGVEDSGTDTRVK